MAAPSNWDTALPPSLPVDTATIDGKSPTILRSFVGLPLGIRGVDVSGEGQLVLEGGTLAVNHSLSNSAVISGTGALHALGNSTFGNDGYILADVDGRRLVLESASVVSNDGHLEAKRGGELFFKKGDYVNNGSIFVGDRSVLKTAVDVANSGTILVAAGGTLNVREGSSFTGNDITSDGLVVVEKGTFETDFVNNGEIKVWGTLWADSDIRVSGQGTIQLGIDGLGSGLITGGDDSSVETFTIGTNQQLVGRGEFGWSRFQGGNAMNIVNQGAIFADDEKQALSIGLQEGLSDFQNHATVGARNGGTLLLWGGTFENHGTIRAEDSSTVRIDDHARIIGGKLDSAGTGEIRIFNGSFERDINNDARTIALGRIKLGTDVAFSGRGKIILDGGSIVGNGADEREKLDIGSSQTVEGRGTIGQSRIAVGQDEVDLTNHGIIDANSRSQSLEINGRTRETRLINDGVMRATNGGRLQLANATLTNSGSISADADSIVRFSNVAVQGDGSWKTNGGTMMFTDGTTADIERLLVDSDGEIEVHPFSEISVSNLELSASAKLDVLGSLEVKRRFAFDTQDGANLRLPQSGLKFSGGTDGSSSRFLSWASLEVGGQDGIEDGFNESNLYLPSLTIDEGAHVFLMDIFDNTEGQGQEALYVDQLVFSDEFGKLNLNGHNIYFNSLVGKESQIVDVGVRIAGDINDDYLITTADIDKLSQIVRREVAASAASGLNADLDSDGMITANDRLFWVSEIAKTSLGDANLDGAVDFGDFLSLSEFFGTEGGWKQGDFDGDGVIRFDDFLVVSANFGLTHTVAAQVPEPGGKMLLLLAFLGSFSRLLRPRFSNA